MPSRSLSFFAVSLPLVVVLGSIPIVGAGLSLQIGAAIWAVAGFRFFLLSALFTMCSEAISLIQWSTFTEQTVSSPVITHAIAGAVKAGYGVEMLLGFVALLLLIPFMLWVLKRNMRRMLAKRLGVQFLEK